MSNEQEQILNELGRIQCSINALTKLMKPRKPKKRYAAYSTALKEMLVETTKIKDEIQDE